MTTLFLISGSIFFFVATFAIIHFYSVLRVQIEREINRIESENKLYNSIFESYKKKDDGESVN